MISNHTLTFILTFIAYFMFARMFYLSVFLDKLMYLVSLLVRIESRELIFSKRNGLIDIINNDIYIHYKYIYQTYKYDKYGKEYVRWAKKSSLWSTILFPFQIYSLYRINQLIKSIEKENNIGD
tara:strand:+ start:2471 stop:2842 length:372 start_codon:yes stop_codon:yes gene_type:complete